MKHQDSMTSLLKRGTSVVLAHPIDRELVRPPKVGAFGVILATRVEDDRSLSVLVKWKGRKWPVACMASDIRPAGQMRPQRR